MELSIMSKIIVLTNQKGGCGKTTMTINLAGRFGKNAKVLVIDGDPQGTSSRWIASASELHPFPAAIANLSMVGNKAHKEIGKYAHDYDYIFVDCPPAVENNFTDSVLLIADLVIVPIIPSPADLWAAVGIQKLIAKVETFNETLKSRLLANMCQSNTSIY